ncbi:hypothetical protein E7Z59_10325 [Robertkochia marina]|uniref:Enhanced serine sensitivity protein SseB n=1 Tax=Robertkochia marina TaxID=1227945 RepID=A0A4S3M1Y6_9FLAO|nr:enhanced serine sensitivity protein SseB C-terminal domain-containing protein [Robertkochia marina]THD68033.1 hypothetical protein E7Z59_10325 [Robertkochia marina]TRZ42683.1 hypothetical protein D3A96_11640 [Robertkochia marina]
MGLFDIFKRRKTDATFPENELEKTLMDATTNVSARTAFYEKLLLNDFVVITNNHYPSEEEVRMLEKDMKVQFATFEDGKIPVFTSTNRIFDKGYIREKLPYLALKGQNLLSITKGSTLILNPYSDFGKELIPSEIESLLNGSIFDKTNEIIIEQDTEVQIGQPAKYPHELVRALSELFYKKQHVNAAYLGAIKMDKTEKLPHLIIAIEIEGSLSSITREAGPLAEKILPNEIIDFIQIDLENGISDYFLNQTEPFYKKD